MRIAAVSDRPDFPWEFIAIKSDQLNAFALPGGQAAVYTKMLDSFTDEELAAVMGHEIAHAVLRHGMEQVSRGQATGAFVGIIGAVVGGGEENADTQKGAMELASLVSAVGVSLPHSRKMELEADHIGTIYMARAGYDPRKAVVLWKKMAALSAGAQKPPKWLSTHPTDTTRIERLEERMDEYMAIYNEAKK